MIIEQHYDDEILIGLLESGDDAARDKHVSSCHTCAGALESLRAVTTGLQEATVWDQRELPETPNRQIKNAIRGFAADGHAAAFRDDAFQTFTYDSVIIDDNNVNHLVGRQSRAGCPCPVRKRC